MIIQNFSTWVSVSAFLRRYALGTVLRVPKGLLPHPKTFGMTESVGLPEGQAADYRKVLPGGRGFHVRDFVTHYEAHLDAVHPAVNLHEHLRVDAPGTYVAGGAALGALLGSAMGKSKDSALVGAAVGGLLAALMTQAKPTESNGTKRRSTR
jgi:hypothetical protein